jgi:diguanylate cyclase (GGDEF)-like protein
LPGCLTPLRDWAIKSRLWLGFGVLVCLLAAGQMFGYWQIHRVNRLLTQVIDVEAPLEQAALEIEIQAGESARSVLNYVIEPNPETAHQAFEAHQAFRRLASYIQSRAEDDEQRRHGQAVDGLYADFRSLGDQMMDLADQSKEAMETLRTDVDQIDHILSDGLLVRIEEPASDQARRVAATQHMKFDVEHIFALVEAYVATGDSVLLPKIEASQQQYREARDLYERADPEPDALKWLARMDERFANAIAAGQRAITIVGELSLARDTLNEDLIQIDDYLDGRLQPLIIGNMQHASNEARTASQKALTMHIVLTILGLLIGIGFGWLLAKGIVDPVIELVKGTEIIGKGKLEYHINLTSKDELGQLAGAFNRMVENLRRSAKELESAQREREQLREQETQLQIETQTHAALTDDLTQIANRRAFDNDIRGRHAEFQRYGCPVSIIMLDVDRFKNFNDSFGHLAGDVVLKGVARVLSDSLRKVDVVARYGGEEFVVICPETKFEDAIQAAQSIRLAIEMARFEFEGQSLQVTASLGLARLVQGEEVADLIGRGDEALYAAKNAGRNCVFYHDGQNVRRNEPRNTTLIKA